jgi:hypothetical protein
MAAMQKTVQRIDRLFEIERGMKSYPGQVCPRTD